MRTASLAVKTVQSPTPAPLGDTASRQSFGVRVADIAGLRRDGSSFVCQRRIPAIPIFDDAVAAFAQGTPFKTETGFVPVEDLQPGDALLTDHDERHTITWIASALFAPAEHRERIQLTRIMTDSFGMNRPQSFITLGSAARIMKAPPDLRNSTVAKHMMTPASRFLDGVNVIDLTPPTPIRLFHIGLQHHAAISAAGLPVESYHPGMNPMSHLSQSLQEAFTGLFPHLHSLSDFGPLRFTRTPECPEDTAAD